MINNGQQNIKKRNSIKLSSVSEVLGILAILATCFVFIFQFSAYLYEMIWFYYWGIDKSFFTQDSMNIINNLMYSIFILLVIVILFIEMHKTLNTTNNKKTRWFKFIIVFIFFYTIFSIKSFYKYDLITFFISYIGGMLICLYILRLYTRKFDKIVDMYNNLDSLFIYPKELIQNLLFIIIMIFIVIIIFGLCNANFTKDYKIIAKNNNACNVILYSTKDYYIIANCQIKNNDLVVYSDTLQKIDNYNIIYEWRSFEKIIKE